MAKLPKQHCDTTFDRNLKRFHCAPIGCYKGASCSISSNVVAICEKLCQDDDKNSAENIRNYFGADMNNIHVRDGLSVRDLESSRLWLGLACPLVRRALHYTNTYQCESTIENYPTGLPCTIDCGDGYKNEVFAEV